jgi:AGZA family xanthine/uracil permease-like MFS transporter
MWFPGKNFLSLKKTVLTKNRVLAGITTFRRWSYIIFVNPSILSDAGMPFNGVFIATKRELFLEQL